MAIRLVRKSSDSPNITNKDDARMIRYAYGNQNGIVAGYGDELKATLEKGSGTLHIGSGRVVLQGWEVDIDEAGIDITELDLANPYHLIYLELSLISETAEIKAIYGNTDIEDSFDIGDDLTTYPSGVARLPLYSITASLGTFGSVSPKVYKMVYPSDLVKSLEEQIKDGRVIANSARLINNVRIYAQSGDEYRTTGVYLIDSGYRVGSEKILWENTEGQRFDEFIFISELPLWNRWFRAIIEKNGFKMEFLFYVPSATADNNYQGSRLLDVEWDDYFINQNMTPPYNGYLQFFPGFVTITAIVHDGNSLSFQCVLRYAVKEDNTSDAGALGYASESRNLKIYRLYEVFM